MSVAFNGVPYGAPAPSRAVVVADAADFERQKKLNRIRVDDMVITVGDGPLGYHIEALWITEAAEAYIMDEPRAKRWVEQLLLRIQSRVARVYVKDRLGISYNRLGEAQERGSWNKEAPHD